MNQSLSSSTSLLRFKVGIEGYLTCNEVGVAGAPILVSYSVNGGESWNDIMQVNTTPTGYYSTEWIPSATGYYLVNAIWVGNDTYPSSNSAVNLAVTSFGEQDVFTVESNSSIAGLTFNSTSDKLSFTVTGSSGTNGYAKVSIAKTLINNIATVRSFFDGEQLDYVATTTDDSWILYLTYQHSLHEIVIKLGIAEPATQTWIYLVVGGIVLFVAALLMVKVKGK